jgi:hypothetical protein
MKKSGAAQRIDNAIPPAKSKFRKRQSQPSSRRRVAGKPPPTPDAKEWDLFMKSFADAGKHLSAALNRRTYPTPPRENAPENGNPGVVAHAIAVFGDRERALDWLRTPNHLFQGKSPEEFARSGGAEEVEKILIRIEYGVFS